MITPRGMTGGLAVAAVVAVLGWSAPVAGAVSMEPDGAPAPAQILTPGSGPNPSHFGQSVDVDGDLMVVGDNRDFKRGKLAGAVYVYARADSGWVPRAKVAPRSLDADDFFGYSVAVSGATIVVGGYTDPPAAYVIEQVDGRWTHTARLDPPPDSADSKFGHSVDIDGDTIVVGAPAQSDRAEGAGAAYVFVRSDSGWSLQARLGLPPVPSDGFGGSVAVDGNTVLVGAGGVDAGADGAGAGYIFTRTGDTWRNSAQLASPDPQPGSGLGGDVALDGDTAVLGQGMFDGGHPRTVYVFVGSGEQWAVQAELVSDQEELFGFEVALAGDTLAVADPYNSEQDFNAGAVHVYRRTGQAWTQLAQLTPPPPVSGWFWANFGWSVGLDSETLAVGQSNPGKGIVNVYER